jgi:SEC-C motif-containing protein
MAHGEEGVTVVREDDTGTGAGAVPCPCLSGETYGDCCGRFHRGEATAPTAERLMRSRYSAFVVGDAAYLLATWHPHTRPRELELDPSMRWRRLDIVDTARGGMLDDEGVVEFRAFYRSEGVDASAGRGVLHERSRFARVAGRWLYVDGDVLLS